VPRLSRLLAGFPPDCFPQFPPLVSPLPAVAEENLPGLSRVSAPPALIIIPLPEALEVRCHRGVPALELVVSWRGIFCSS
jgi:hypothetical protein